MFTQYRKRLHLKQVKKSIFPKSYQPIEWQKKRLPIAGILIHANIFEDASFQRFLQKLEQRFQVVQVLGFLDEKPPSKPMNHPIFTKKQLNWIWKPKGIPVKDFTNQQFDLLINLCQQNCLPLEYLAATSKAHYKIGAAIDYPNQYDLIIKTDDFTSYLDQINFFLKKFKNDRKVAVNSLRAFEK